MYLRDGSAWINCTCCHTKIETADQTYYLTSILISGQPVPVLTQCRKVPGRVATGVPKFEVTLMVQPGKAQGRVVCLFVGCLTSRQHASVSQGRICSDNFTCCHTEIEVADLTFHLTQSQYTNTGPTSPSTDPITPGAWQGSHWSANF